MEEKGTSLVQAFAKQQNEAIRLKDETKLLQALLELMKDPEIYDGAVLDPEGRIIAHTEISKVGGIDRETPRRMHSQTPQGVSAWRIHGPVPLIMVEKQAKTGWESAFEEDIFLSEPSQKIVVGTVRLGMSMQPLFYFMSRIRNGMATIAGAILLLSALFAFLFAMIISGPLNKLVLAAEEIGRGNLEAHIAITSHDEIGQLADTLNQMTRDLHNSQDKLLQSEKLAAIGQLASGVGHELRNPLAAINNAIYYIRDCVKGTPLAAQDQNLVEFLDLADREIRNATHIIHDLLDFTRTPKLILQPTDINSVLLEAKGMVDIPPTVKVIERLGEDLPQLTVDHEKMRQVFINLLQNAVQAMTEGGDLSISTRLSDGPEDSKQRFFLVELRDTGSGIKERDQRKIFEPLFTTKAKGTGLGLPISLGIVQKHGGEILVVSKEGTGATFTVRLPLGAST